MRIDISAGGPHFRVISSEVIGFSKQVICRSIYSKTINAKRCHHSGRKTITYLNILQARYINITRFDIPDASIEDMIERTYNKAIELVCSKGGKVKGDMVYVNPKAQFIPPMEFCIGPNPDLEIGQPTDYSFACRTNADFKWELVKGKLPAGVTFQNGKLAGTPTEAGKYPITLQLSANKAEPETMEVDADNYQIPLVIGKLRDT